MTAPGEIVINNKAAFQSAIDKMQELNSTLAERLKGADQVHAAVTAAAGKGVVTGVPAGAGGQVAGAYAGTVGALDTATRNLTSQAQAASAAVDAAASELSALLAGLTDIDDTGAGNVHNS